MAYFNKQVDQQIILISIFCFVDDFLKFIVNQIEFALQRPNKNLPPLKKHNLSLAELITLFIFRFFTGHQNWKQYYDFLKTYHIKDFPNLPDYSNFIRAKNELMFLSLMLSDYFMKFFKKYTKIQNVKFADSTKLEVCKIKREFSHKVCKEFARKSKSSMGWFYGFKLHIICNELMQILNFTITKGSLDDRKGLEKIWNDIFGLIIADAGYVGKNWQEKSIKLGKFLLAAVRSNMKKLMSQFQHQLLKMREYVETVFSVLKTRFGLETSLPRSPLGYLAHYLWCITAYQMDKFFEFVFGKNRLEMAGIK
jgi:hypothetical protein